MRLRLLFAALAALTALASSASAEPLAPTLVRLLRSPGRPHPLADASGHIPISIALPPGTDAAAIGVREVAAGVGAIRLAPDDVAAFASLHPDLPIAVAPKFHPLLDVSGAWTHVDEFRNATGLSGKGAIVGIVDTGVDVRHPDFRDANGKTRIAWMLAGGSPKGFHKDLEDKFGCTDPKGTPCAVYSADDIDALLATNSSELGDTDGHGTHVASIAAGNGGPSVTKKPRYVGIAPDATIIVGAPPESGGFFDTDILNAARFVFDRADALGKPAVVNFSLGGDYGSHDGTSNLEKGLSALVGDDKPGRAIVVAAGNSGDVVDPHDGTGPFGIHTEAHVIPGEVVRVPIVAGAAKDGQGYVWITFRPGDDVEVALEGPGKVTWVGFTAKGKEGGYAVGSGDDALNGGVINAVPSTKSLITKETNSAVAIFTGHWAESSEFAILLRGSGDASLWIAGQGDASGKLYFERAIRQGTINVPASAPALLAVGCTLNRTSWKPLTGQGIELGALGGDPNPVPDSACYFSATGPTPFGVLKPEISAPGGFIAGAMSAGADPRIVSGGLFALGGCPDGGTTCAVVDDYHALASGTSMSAPHVAGAIALLMELDPTLTQARVTEVLQQGARWPIGHIPDHDQLGPGALDLEGARHALLDSMFAPAEPSLNTSWYTLSSSYARPDPTWPVWGTIQLRRENGSIAGGVDGSKIGLSLRGGGMIYQPLTRVRPGLFQFAIAGLEADFGRELVLDVTYAGTSLGSRTLPVGVDVWQANDRSLGADSGGCACSAAGERRDLSAPTLIAIAAAIAVARRRKS